jgi:hypothetical protein
VIAELRDIVLEGDPDVSERLEDGKWLSGYLKYDSPGGAFVYAIGAKSNGMVSFHAMTYYGSPDLRRRVADALARNVAGRSCFDFDPTHPLPAEAISQMVSRGSEYVDSFRKPAR